MSKELPPVKMPIASVEMQEYLFARNLTMTAIKCAKDGDHTPNYQQLDRGIRECFRFQRFALMSWLQQNGVSIPAELLSDQAHPPVGAQMPDQSDPKHALLNAT